ncbi:MAG: glutaredoxin 3 [Candidatus Competibacteraceae bacterium]|nr:glutaredoxin 3 [Candidatus Competibacteraceae bacterium]
MPEILLYATKFCPYCRRARALLDSKGVSYKVLDVNQNPALWKEINDRTGRNTVPQIFIGGRHVGGCDDLYDIERRGELDPLLQGA